MIPANLRLEGLVRPPGPLSVTEECASASQNLTSNACDANTGMLMLAPANMRQKSGNEFRIEISDVFSQAATDPNTNHYNCTGIGCWLTKKRFGSRNFEFVFQLGTSCMEVDYSVIPPSVLSRSHTLQYPSHRRKKEITKSSPINTELRGEGLGDSFSFLPNQVHERREGGRGQRQRLQRRRSRRRQAYARSSLTE